jgi:hypothetical protein
MFEIQIDFGSLIMHILTMEKQRRSAFIRVVLVFIAAGAAYYIGWSRGTIPHRAATGSPKAGPNLPPAPSVAAAPMATNAKAFDRARADKILDQWKYALDNPRERMTAELFSKLMSNTWPADMPYLVDELSKLQQSPDRNAVIDELIDGLSFHDPAKALSEVDNILDIKKRNDMIGNILGIWLAQDPDHALAALTTLPSGQTTQAAFLQAFLTWAGANTDFGAPAATAALGLPPGPNQVAALKGVAAGWAINNPQAALDWASNLPPADSSVLGSAVIAAAKTQLQLATPYLNQMTDATARNQAIQTIAMNMDLQDPAGTMAWLDQVATGDTYQNTVVKVITNLAVNQPATASTLLAQVTEPGVADAVIAKVSNGSWARVNPNGVAAWLQTLPQSAARDAAVQKLAQGTGGN